MALSRSCLLISGLDGPPVSSSEAYWAAGRVFARRRRQWSWCRRSTNSTAARIIRTPRRSPQPPGVVSSGSRREQRQQERHLVRADCVCAHVCHPPAGRRRSPELVCDCYLFLLIDEQHGIKYSGFQHRCTPLTHTHKALAHCFTLAPWSRICNCQCHRQNTFQL